MKRMSLAFITTSILLVSTADAKVDQMATQNSSPNTVPALNTTKTPATDARSTNMELGMAAAEKLMEATLAQVDGDISKMNTALADAIVIYNKILATVPTDTQTLNARSTAKNMLQKGDGKEDSDTVIQLTTEIISKDPTAGDAFHDRAVAYRTAQNFDQARKDFQTAISLKPEKTWWVNELKAMEVEAK